MTTELEINRVIPLDAMDALKEAIIAAIGTGKYGGMAVRKSKYYLIFEPNVNAQDQNTALQLALGFDTNTRTVAQIQETNEGADLQTLLNQADAAITTIGTELTAIASDVTALAAAGTLGAVKPIVQNMLDRQTAMDTRQRAIIRALKRMRHLL